MKTANLHIRVSERLKQAVEEAAKADNRTVSSLVETLLIRHLEPAGYYERDEE